MSAEEAIRLLDQTTQEEALKEAGGGWHGVHAMHQALDMAIAALRAQQSKLDRSRWEGCDLCISWDTGKPIDDMRGDIITHHGACTSCYGFGEIYDYRDKKVLGYFKFCPYCGRPITDEAWAELERRINDGTVF